MVIPTVLNVMTFGLEVPACDSSSDYLELLIDGNREWLIDGSSPLCGAAGYSTQSVPIGSYADDGIHAIEFHSEMFTNNSGPSNFFLDVTSIPGTVSQCISAPVIFSDGFESN